MSMKQVTKARLADGLLKVIAVTSVTATVLVAPNTLQMLDKPLQRFLKKMDERERKRLIGEALAYMRYSRLIVDDYQHGLKVTDKAKKRLDRLEIESLTIVPPAKWDGAWRIVFFDIPETHKSARDGFSARIKQLGFGVLQRSVFICPHPCREEVTLLARYYKVDAFVTYIETSYIDNDSPLKEHFSL